MPFAQSVKEDAMAMKVFTISLQNSEGDVQEVNAFLANHKLLSMDRRWVDLGTASFWSLCIDYIASGTASATTTTQGKLSKVDYKDLLPPFERGYVVPGASHLLVAKDACPGWILLAEQQVLAVLPWPAALLH